MANKINKEKNETDLYKSFPIGFNILSFFVITFISFSIGYNILYSFVLDFAAAMILLIFTANFSDALDHNKIKFTVGDSINFVLITIFYDLFWFFSLKFSHNLFSLFGSVTISIVLYISLFAYYQILIIRKRLITW